MQENRRFGSVQISPHVQAVAAWFFVLGLLGKIAKFIIMKIYTLSPHQLMQHICHGSSVYHRDTNIRYSEQGHSVPMPKDEIEIMIARSPRMYQEDDAPYDLKRVLFKRVDVERYLSQHANSSPHPHT